MMILVLSFPHPKSQTWFKAEIEELADVQSYKVQTEDGRIRRQKPQTSLQEQRAILQLTTQRGSCSLSRETPRTSANRGSVIPNSASSGDQSKQPNKTPVAIRSKAQPLCTTLNQSQLVELIGSQELVGCQSHLGIKDS